MYVTEHKRKLDTVLRCICTAKKCFEGIDKEKKQYYNKDTKTIT